MPKERRDRSVSYDSSRAYPYPCSSSPSVRSLPKDPSGNEENVKEWEEARCPICMEHPHNAILLTCSSYEKGCRPYMCDTSYRHSNCFDQFRKTFADTCPSVPQQEETPVPTTHSSHLMIPEGTITSFHVERSEGSTAMHEICENQMKGKLVCPLCRGGINGWIVVEPARLYMNAKSRSCACETCDFTGTCADLRKHARLVHPHVRPSVADPVRQRDWRRLERERDIGDLFSSLQSSIGEERSEDSSLSFIRGMTVVLLVRVVRPGSSSRRSSWGHTSGSRTRLTTRRRSTRLWGDSYDEESSDQNNELSDGGSEPWRQDERIGRQPTPDES